jgi:UDP-hydrolysing UDP-N-acetyl-D-glucosamine 2-epimerase
MMTARRIAVLSTGRQDWGILRELCRLLRAEPGFELLLMLGGMHGAAGFGRTRELVLADGFQPCAELNWIDETQPLDPERQAGDAVWMTARALRAHRAEALVLMGDRFETTAAALGATLARVPIIHLHGGEETAGAIDDALRHAITKLSHLHFTSHRDHTARVIALGEDPATVHTVGAPGLDNLRRTDLPERAELEQLLGLELRAPVVIVTHHPATLGADAGAEAAALIAAMDAIDATYVITLPNADPGHEAVRAAMLTAARRPRRKAVEALGDRRYWGLMRIADALLGNSSSALIEAPAIGLPAVNVGARQQGRVRGENVIDAPPDPAAIAGALRQALSAEFRARSKAAPSPFGGGGASRRIVDVLRGWTPPQPPIKRSVPL